MKPLWFGPEHRPLFGWLHVPADGQVRGGVLLCPTLGMEAVSAHNAYRRLADRLADAGFAALRFDYEGTGDSSGLQHDPGRLATWLQSIRTSLDLLKSLELPRTSVVGMRLGATLVAESMESVSPLVDDLVLWDPCASGRSYLREQGALWSFTPGSRSNEDGSVETPGFVYDKDTVAELSTLAIANGEGPMAERILVLKRAGRKGSREMNERLEMPHVDQATITGQEDLVDVRPHAAVVPGDTLETIVGWLAARAASSPFKEIDADGIGRTRAAIGEPDGVMVDERTLCLGPLGLFGIMTSCSGTGEPLTDTENAGSKGQRPPTIVLLNAGVIDHAGPARLWVDLARSWAAAGLNVVRFDLSGIGDSPVHEGQRDQIVFPREAVQDVLDVLRDISPDDPENAVLVGLSSGAYHAMEVALVSRVRAVCAVNAPIATIAEESPPATVSAAGDPNRVNSDAMKGWTDRLLNLDWFSSVLHRLPEGAWWFVNRVALGTPPARKLSEVIEAGVNVFVIVGTEEAMWLTRGEGPTMRRLSRSERFRLKVIPDLEHSLFERHGRELAAGLVTDYVLTLPGTLSRGQRLSSLPPPG
jgi:alpha-beta hydrolase superfamily lysophospholipase